MEGPAGSSGGGQRREMLSAACSSLLKTTTTLGLTWTGAAAWPPFRQPQAGPRGWSRPSSQRPSCTTSWRMSSQYDRNKIEDRQRLAERSHDVRIASISLGRRRDHEHAMGSSSPSLERERLNTLLGVSFCQLLYGQISLSLDVEGMPGSHDRVPSRGRHGPCCSTATVK